MSGIIGKQEHFVSRLWMLLMLFASVGSLLSCSKQENATAEKPATEKTFASPADAGAVRSRRLATRLRCWRSSVQTAGPSCSREIQ